MQATFTYQMPDDYRDFDIQQVKSLLTNLYNAEMYEDVEVDFAEEQGFYDYISLLPNSTVNQILANWLADMLNEGVAGDWDPKDLAEETTAMSDWFRSTVLGYTLAELEEQSEDI